MDKIQELKEKILQLSGEYYDLKFKNKKEFEPGDKISYAGRVFDEKEIRMLIDSALDFWLTMGEYSNKFEAELANFLEVKYCSLVNSGSSANLLAFMALTSKELGDRRIKKGDEVITVAASFPTTVSPIIQYGAIPVFVDIVLPYYNIDVSKIRDAISDKTKAIMIAHTLGNPFDLSEVRKICDEYNLWLIEDNCDSLGSKYLYNDKWMYTGTIGDIGTSSFYPAHHITMGEGGAVYTNNITLKKLINSFRDWGRDCWCNSGKDNTCLNRFTQKFGELPYGYDHKYVYSHFGYNLKVTDMQAAIGCAQLEKLDDFIKDRQKNWNILKNGLKCLENKLILPEATPNSDPSWFGFLITVRNEANFKRDDITKYLENNNIQTRNLFAGNLIKHPCFDEMRNLEAGYRICGPLTNTDIIMSNSFWIGVYPGMTEKMLQYTINKIKEFTLTK